ncbi:MAG: hypothetical protein H6739_18475 [Alphaproteobacteria bacterium]|nr:hypothetical protein [Alphaproteobacteria bacterium]
MTLLMLLVACKGSLVFDTTDDIRAACEANEPQDVELSVTFEGLNEGCPWNSEDNLSRTDAMFTARIEQVESLDIPEGGVICDLEFDFGGISGGEGQSMLYDDNFLFALNDAVLAASYGPMVDNFATNDDLAIYDWADVVGTDLLFNNIPDYCLGRDSGESECTIPAPETQGTLALAFGGDLVDQLALVAVQSGLFDFKFVTFGDNDDTDCSHETFTFTVIAPVVTP